MEDTVEQIPEKELTLAEFYDQSEKEARDMLEQIQNQRIAATNLGLLSAKYKDVQHLTQHAMFF